MNIYYLFNELLMQVNAHAMCNFKSLMSIELSRMTWSSAATGRERSSHIDVYEVDDSSENDEIETGRALLLQRATSLEQSFQAD